MEEAAMVALSAPNCNVRGLLRRSERDCGPYSRKLLPDVACAVCGVTATAAGVGVQPNNANKSEPRARQRFRFEREKGAEFCRSERAGLPQMEIRSCRAKACCISGRPVAMASRVIVPVILGREAIGLALILEQHAKFLFANRVRPSGLLSVKGTANAERYRSDA